MAGKVRSFLSFSRTERFGVLALAILLVLLLAARLAVRHWPKSDVDPAQAMAYNEAYNRYEQAAAVENEDIRRSADAAGPGDTAREYLDAGVSRKDFPDTLDVNTATAEQFKMLKGVGAVTAAKIVAKRAEQGGFNTVEEFRQACNLSEKVYRQLRPHLKVSPLKH